MKWLLLIGLALAGPAHAGGFSFSGHPGQFQKPAVVTQEQIKAACMGDVRKLCAKSMSGGPDAIKACMREKQSKISDGCMTVLTAAGALK